MFHNVFHVQYLSPQNYKAIYLYLSTTFLYTHVGPVGMTCPEKKGGMELRKEERIRANTPTAFLQSETQPLHARPQYTCIVSVA